jgi:hypothetical protein
MFRRREFDSVSTPRKPWVYGVRGDIDPPPGRRL